MIFENLNFNVFNVIILLGIIQGFIFGIFILLSTKYNSKTNSYLSYTSFSLSLSNFQYWLSDIKINESLTFIDELRIPSEFLIIPMFYLFVKRYLNNPFSNRFRTLLFLPFIVDFIFQIIVTFNNNCKENFISEKSIYIFYFIEEFCSLCFSSILIIMIIKEINQYEKLNNNFLIEVIKVKTSWIKNILFIGLLACFIWIIELYLMSENNNGMLTYYPIWIIITLIIYWLSYSGLINSNILLERQSIRKTLVSFQNTLQNKPIKKLDNNSQNLIFEEFELIVKSRFLNPYLTLDEVSKELGITSNYLSQIINSRNIKFNDYLNSIRVEKVKSMLLNKDYSNYTITSIGLEAGFNSNASFYRAFKKATNLSPKEYKLKG